MLETLKFGPRGTAFYEAVQETYEGLRPDELEILAESCRVLDLLESGGLHVVEERQQRHLLRALLRQLALPDVETGEDWKSGRARVAANARWGIE